MKKIVCGVLIAFIGFIFSACGSQDENTERVNDTGSRSSNDNVPVWLERFYNSDYEYRKSTIVLEPNHRGQKLGFMVMERILMRF